MVRMPEGAKLFTSRKVAEIAKALLRHENATLSVVAVVLIGIFGYLSKGFTLTPANIINVILQSSTRGVASIGEAIVLLTAGIDLSVGGMALLSMCVGALMMSGTTGFPTAIIAIMILLGVGVGATNGLGVSRLGMPPLIVTLSTWIISGGVALWLTKGCTIIQLPREVGVIGQGDVAGVPVTVIIFIVVAGVAYFVLNYTSFGRSIYATGGNPVSAWLSGINVRVTRHLAYVISGACSALAGLIIMSRIMCATQIATTGLELDAIAAVAIGGISLAGGSGSIIGVVIGVMILGIINNGMSVLAVPPALMQVTKGAIIYGAVAIDTIRRRR